MITSEHGLASTPNPMAIMAGTWQYKGPNSIQGVPFLSYETPVLGEGEVFAERSIVSSFLSLRRLVGVMVVPAIAIGLGTFVLLVDWSNIASDWRGAAIEALAVIGISLCVEVVVIGLVWSMERWCRCQPLAMQLGESGLLVRVRGRSSWAPLSEFSPSFSVGEISFRRPPGMHRAGMPATGLYLPYDLKHKSHAVWMALAFADRVRWVFLDAYASEEDAYEAIDTWKSLFRLEDAPTGWVYKATPKNVAIMRNNIFTLFMRDSRTTGRPLWPSRAQQ